jgi:uncharacterized phage protein (predicted DNA packaging)
MAEPTALTLEEIKLYLRVDETEEDNLITSLELFSREEIEESTGASYEMYKTIELYKIAQLIIITDRYENRASQDSELKSNTALNSIYQKLKCKVAIYEEESSESTE